MFTDCPNNDKPKCANCGGSHSAVSSQCRAYIEAKSALASATKSKLAYRDAVLKFKPSQELEHSETSQVAQTATQASTRLIDTSITKRLEKNDSEIQTEPISVKTESCNTLQVREKDKAIITELRTV